MIYRHESRAALSARIRELRAKKGLGQEDIAARSGLSRNGISVIECGRCSPSLETIQAIAFALDVEPVELIQGIPAQPR